MRAGIELQSKLPAGYAVSGYSEPWFIVVKSWDGKPLAADFSREITDKLSGLEVRGPKFEDGSLIWAVQGPEADGEKPTQADDGQPAAALAEQSPPVTPPRPPQTPTRETPRGGRPG